MNIRDVRSDKVPVRVKPEPTGTTYRDDAGNVMAVKRWGSYENGMVRFTTFCGANPMVQGCFVQSSFSKSQRQLDAFAKRARFRRLP